MEFARSIPREETMPSTLPRILASLLLLSAVAFPASAQNAGGWQFRWQKGQTLSYRVEHTTSVVEVVNGTRSESASKLNLVKRWQVADVDAKNIATLQLTLMSMRHEQTRTNGEKLLFDSNDLAKSTPELKEQMGQYIGKTVASLRIDGYGRVVEVLQGAANRYESEPPFLLLLPAQVPQQGQAWKRTFNVSLDPPFGAGEKFPATQTYQVSSITDGKATIALVTELQSQPEAVADRAPLLQKQPRGEVIFDFRTGQLVGAHLSINKTLENHSGAGSSYQFNSEYVEEIMR
jgi:hypothetical protein